MQDTPLDTLELVGNVSADLVLSTVLLFELGGGGPLNFVSSNLRLQGYRQELKWLLFTLIFLVKHHEL